MDSKESWIALIVKPRLERKAESGLTNAGIETFVAWHGVRRRWSDRVKVVRENLFPGYLFCRSVFADRATVLRQPGVQGVVSIDRTPVTVPDDEIDAVVRLLGSGLPLGPWPFLKAGQEVVITHGPLAGLEGILVRDCASWRVVVSVRALQRSVSTQVDRDMIAPCSRSATAA